MTVFGLIIAIHPQDSMWLVIKEGGPMHTRLGVKDYIKRLKETGREKQAAIMINKHPDLAEEKE
ncbi:MAG: hypothetical protein K9J16_03025 [Melioribacteraceae bacterium]|nr:hypothetical protein [Melioribacteraceae bacterium]MCF8355472.1 hypothetical protein [Melioribacteraceae bacterium]MCF8392551.1 hypothetical protein [Melioribacteraceae bacterium]MCF8418434.1 hypothetical protein [Melioribacteraceae bacterium]